MVYYLSADKKVINSNKSSYVAVAYDSNEDNTDDNDLYYVKATQTVKRNMFPEVDYTETTFKLLPMLQIDEENQQRTICVLYGSSGSGKSYLANKIAMLYKQLYRRNKIYFISNNDYKNDKALTHEIYTFINLDKLMEHYESDDALEDFKNNDDYANSLIVFDDIDLEENIPRKKIFFNFLDIILKFKRKKMINVIYTTHAISDYKYTRTLINEQNMYVSFNTDLRNRSNNIYTTYLKLTGDEISRITNNEKSRWTAINTRMKLVITESEIYRLI